MSLPNPDERFEEEALHLRLTKWAQSQRQQDAIAEREAAFLQERLATDEAKFSGVIIDSLEQRHEVIVTVTNGRTRRGRITKASTTLVELAVPSGNGSSKQTISWIAGASIAAIAIQPRRFPLGAGGTADRSGPTPSPLPSSRDLAEHPTLATQLSGVEADQPQLTIWVLGNETAFAGRLRWVGQDVLSLETPVGVTHINMAAIVEVAIS